MLALTARWFRTRRNVFQNPLYACMVCVPMVAYPCTRVRATLHHIMHSLQCIIYVHVHIHSVVSCTPYVSYICICIYIYIYMYTHTLSGTQTLCECIALKRHGDSNLHTQRTPNYPWLASEEAAGDSTHTLNDSPKTWKTNTRFVGFASFVQNRSAQSLKSTLSDYVTRSHCRHLRVTTLSAPSMPPTPHPPRARAPRFRDLHSAVATRQRIQHCFLERLTRL
jgi:hypothetical protein